MIVRRITLRGVTTHEALDLQLPPRGVVLVTGTNGSGKSTLVEATPLAVWGKTLRGAQVWSSSDSSCAVEFADPSSDGATYEAVRRNKGAVKLSHGPTNTRDRPTRDTTTKAQEALDQVVRLSFDQWRRACVLSSSDASSFTQASDAERKRLVEEMVGTERLEVAYRAAREKHKSFQVQHLQLTSELAVVDERISGLHQQIQGLTEVLQHERAPAPPENIKQPLPPQEVERLSKLHRQVLDEVAQVEKSLRQQDQEQVQARAAYFSAMKHAERLRDDLCPTCGQPISEHLRHELARDVQAAEKTAQEADAHAEARRKENAQEVEDLHQEAKALQDKLEQDRSARAAHQAYERELAKAQAQNTKIPEQLSVAHKALELAESKREALEATREECAHNEVNYRAVVQTLSTRGVRALLLQGALDQVEKVSNYWLTRICEGRYRLKLSSTETKKDGEARDVVSLKVEADTEVGGGRGYESLSGGERRRVDIALTLALSQVAEAMTGAEGSTLFCDEIFDALDDQGIRDCCDVLREISKDRCVVVISHSPSPDLRDCASTVLSLRPPEAA